MGQVAVGAVNVAERSWLDNQQFYSDHAVVWSPAQALRVTNSARNCSSSASRSASCSIAVAPSATLDAIPNCSSGCPKLDGNSDQEALRLFLTMS